MIKLLLVHSDSFKSWSRIVFILGVIWPPTPPPTKMWPFQVSTECPDRAGRMLHSGAWDLWDLWGFWELFSLQLLHQSFFSLVECHSMHVHILIFSTDLRKPLCRFLELPFCKAPSSLELCPAPFSWLSLPELQSVSSICCWDLLGFPPPTTAPVLSPWSEMCRNLAEARVVLGLLSFVSVLSGIKVLYCLLSSVYKQWCHLFCLVF